MSGRIAPAGAAPSTSLSRSAWYTVDASRRIRTFRRAGDKLAQRFGMPGIGVPRRQRSRRLAGLRMHPVRDFEKHLVFYRPIAGGD